MSVLAERGLMNPKVECVIIGVASPGASGEILVSVRDSRPAKEDEDENPGSGMRLSHILLSPEVYRAMGLMVGDRVTLEMAKV